MVQGLSGFAWKDQMSESETERVRERGRERERERSPASLVFPPHASSIVWGSASSWTHNIEIWGVLTTTHCLYGTKAAASVSNQQQQQQCERSQENKMTKKKTRQSERIFSFFFLLHIFRNDWTELRDAFLFFPIPPGHTQPTPARIGSVLAPGPSSGRDNAWPITKDQWHAPASVVVVRGREDKGKAERAAERRNTVGPKHNNGGGDFFFLRSRHQRKKQLRESQLPGSIL